MKHLIPMTDFVDDIDNLVPREIGQDFDAWIYKQFSAIQRYTKFLKQPLTLEMFTPCDEEGNILEEPKQTSLTCSFFEHQQFFNKQIKYEKAKEKVLFIFPVAIDISTIKHHIGQNRTIEYLTKFNDIQLTESAIKKIGL